MPAAAARGTGTRTPGAGAQGAQVAKFLHQQGNTRDQVHAQLRRNGYSDADATRIADQEFHPAPAPGPAARKPTPAPKAQPKRSRPRSGGSRRTSSGPRVAGTVRAPGTLGGALLALITYPLFVAWLRGGNAEAKAWFEAKFLNKTSTGNTRAANDPSTSVYAHGVPQYNPGYTGKQSPFNGSRNHGGTTSAGPGAQ